MSDFLVPIQTVNVVSSGGSVSQSRGSRYIVKVRDVKLAVGAACRNEI